MGVTVLYRASATALGGRDGSVATEDGQFSASLSTPKALGGVGGDGLNPEQLFAAGYAACFLGAMKFVASQSGAFIVSDKATVTATVGIGPRSAGGFGLDVDLAVFLPGLETASAKDLVAQTHHVCPYSNATHGNIRVDFTVTS